MKIPHNMNDHYTKLFNDFLHETKGTHFSIAHEIYNIITSCPNEERLDALMAICEIYGKIKPTSSARLCSSSYQENLADIKEKVGSIVKSKFDAYVNKNYPRRAFYKKCYSFIFNGKTLKEESSRILALYMLLIDMRIPYYPYSKNSIYEMKEERFGELLEATSEERKLIKNYIYRRFPQKTMQASAILDVMGMKRPQVSDTSATDKYEKLLIEMCYVLFYNK